LQEQEIYLLIIRYFSLETTSEENEIIADWIKASPENEETFEGIKTVWFTAIPQKSNDQIDKALDKTRLKLGFETEVKNKASKGLLSILSYTAAFGLIICTILFFIFKEKSSKGPVVTLLEKRTGRGEKLKIVLEDGSIVSIAPESNIKYPNKFYRDHRDVYLTGEAYFVVTKNPHKPFTVHSGTWKTSVFGTKFNISAYPEQTYLAVSLLEGKVRVTNNKYDYNLVPGQQLFLDKKNNRIYLSNFDQTIITGWLTNKLVFKNEPLSQAAEKINLLYGVKIVFENERTSNCKIWGTFNNEPLQSILDALKLSSNIQYRIEGNIIYLSMKSKP